MDLVRLFKVAGHLRQQLVLADANVHREAQGFFDFVFDPVRQLQGVGIDQLGVVKVAEALVDGHLLHHGGVILADCDEGPGVLHVELEIRLGQHQLRALPQGHCHWLAGGDFEFFGRDGLGQDDASALLRVPADGRGDQPQIRLPLGYPPRRLPAQVSAVHIDMKNQLSHNSASGLYSKGSPMNWKLTIHVPR